MNINGNNINYSFKRHDTKLQDRNKNNNDSRIFRDICTEQYTDTILNDPIIIPLFLDYTFHALYSELILNVNLQLIRNINLEENIHIQPLVGDEAFFLIFKGGTLMKNNFDRHFLFRGDDLNIDLNNLISFFNLNNINHNLTEYNYDIDGNKILNDKPPNFDTLYKKIISKNFKTSDIDYSLFINAENNDRYYMIHKCCTDNLYNSLVKITDNFENYLDSVLNRNLDMSDYPIDVRYQSFYNKNYTKLKLLTYLKNFLDKKNNIEAIMNNDINIINELQNNQDILNLLKQLYLFYRYCKTQNMLNPEELNFDNIDDINIDGENIPYNDLFYLYDLFNIVILLLYTVIINENINFNLHFRRPRVVINLTTNSLLNIIVALRTNISNIVNVKFNKLVNINFYTIDKLNNLRTKISGFYNDISDNSYFENKFDIKSNYMNINDNIKSLRLLRPNERAGHVINVNDINLEKKKSVILLSNPEPFQNNIIEDINSADNPEKVHYITYNNLILQTINNNSIITDFDLIRSKFNIIIKSNLFTKIENNTDVPFDKKYISIPSEFIDVSIVRYNDTASKHFFHEIQNHNDVPFSIGYNLTSNNYNQLFSDVKVFSYSPKQITEDIFYILTTKSYFEPWIDKKYSKRIIRGVVLINMLIKMYNTPTNYYLNRNILMNHNYHPDIWGNIRNVINQNSNMNEDYKLFFTYSMYVYQYIKSLSDAYMSLENNNDPNDIRKIRNNIIEIKRNMSDCNDILFIRFLNNFDDNNHVDKQIKYNYIVSIRKEMINTLLTCNTLPLINIDKKYSLVEDILKIIFYWTVLFSSDDIITSQIINKFSMIFGYIPIYYDNCDNYRNHVKNIDIFSARNKFTKFIRIIYDYGFKLFRLVYRDTGNNLSIPQLLNLNLNLH
jgi:hypothetical protein